MTRRLHLVLSALALAVLALAALAGRHQIARRFSPEQLQKGWSARLAQLPLVLGDWEATVNGEESEFQPGAGGAIKLTFYHPKARQSIDVLLLEAPLGALAGLGPEQSYLTPLRRESPAEPITVTWGNSSASLQTATFAVVPSGGSRRLRILWSWYVGGAWQAPELPGMAWGRFEPALKVLFVAEEPWQQRPEDSCVQELARLLLPEIGQVLAPAE